MFAYCSGKREASSGHCGTRRSLLAVIHHMICRTFPLSFAYLCTSFVNGLQSRASHRPQIAVELQVLSAQPNNNPNNSASSVVLRKTWVVLFVSVYLSIFLSFFLSFLSLSLSSATLFVPLRWSEWTNMLQKVSTVYEFFLGARGSSSRSSSTFRSISKSFSPDPTKHMFALVCNTDRVSFFHKLLPN